MFLFWSVSHQPFPNSEMGATSALAVIRQELRKLAHAIIKADNSSMLKSATLCFLFSGLAICSAGGQVPTPCRNQQVDYREAPLGIREKIQVGRSVKIPEPDAAKKRIPSPQGTRWFIEVEPDFTGKGPWTTTLYIGNTMGSETALEAVFKDHGNTFSAKWINDKLLFVQVGWGHIASSDIILDVNQGKMIYHELANYSELVEPCE